MCVLNDLFEFVSGILLFCACSLWNTGKGSTFFFPAILPSKRFRRRRIPSKVISVKPLHLLIYRSFRCDIYGEVCPSECATLSEGFIKVVEIVNRLRRVAKNRRAENAARKAATGLKVLHRGANPSVMSNPDLQSAPNTPKVDSPLSNLALVDLQKYVRTIGVELEVRVCISRTVRALHMRINRSYHPIQHANYNIVWAVRQFLSV